MFLFVFSFPVKLGSGFVCLFCFVFLSILWCILSHSQEDLAKFGYTPDMKEETSKNPFVFGYLLEPVCTNRPSILKFYFLKSGKFPIFSFTKSLEATILYNDYQHNIPTKMVSSVTGLISKVQCLALRFQIVLFLGWKITNKWHTDSKTKKQKQKKGPINFMDKSHASSIGIIDTPSNIL